jgi:ferritin
MKIIEKLIDHITDEIEGAEEYAEKSIECRARGHNTRATKYKEMAHDELRHAEEIYTFAEEDIEAIRRAHPLTVDEEELWAHFKKRMHEHVSRIKNYIN